MKQKISIEDNILYYGSPPENNFPITCKNKENIFILKNYCRWYSNVFNIALFYYWRDENDKTLLGIVLYILKILRRNQTTYPKYRNRTSIKNSVAEMCVVLFADFYESETIAE